LNEREPQATRGAGKERAVYMSPIGNGHMFPEKQTTTSINRHRFLSLPQPPLTTASAIQRMETTDPWADWLKEYEEMQRAKQASVPKSYAVRFLSFLRASETGG
jgi:hypothetical protein